MNILSKKDMNAFDQLCFEIEKDKTITLKFQDRDTTGFFVVSWGIDNICHTLAFKDSYVKSYWDTKFDKEQVFEYYKAFVESCVGYIIGE